jgi:hypothetical protein
MDEGLVNIVDQGRRETGSVFLIVFLFVLISDCFWTERKTKRMTELQPLPDR